ncbi:hypothetical protein U9M48_021006 [Paspalum notatum var. saurae]|uniref:DNA mismatch repair proteins mutS family domain-containing protein n=1 Tax=Paspalum notatum var. saurae TaxID=547442 RepID=A0AAQ3TGC0_PASNO
MEPRRRQQQQSILSFLQKQPPSRREGTPPEKPPTGSVAGIMERLVRPQPPQPQGRNQDASQFGHLEGKPLPVKNQLASNERSSTLFSPPRDGECSRAILFPEGCVDMSPLQEPQKHSLRYSADESIRASTLAPEFGSNQTPIHKYPKKLSSESINDHCIRATALFEDFDVQTPSQVASRKIFPGPAHGADTPLTECGSDQTPLQHSSKKFSFVSANGECTRAAATFGSNSNDSRTKEPSKKLWSGASNHLFIKPTNLLAELEANETPLKNDSRNSSWPVNDKHVGAAAMLFPELDSSPLKPQIPATQAVIPPLKRVQEDLGAAANKQCYPFGVLSKKIKSAHHSTIENKDHDEMVDSARSKFEWLNPFSIKDANGRRPNDPLYDKSTLFIPPDALRKMSTSQKQYWNIKSKYMDVVLFFKVGKFYELYELDAEIGQKELDWKMTVSGVGKCRQHSNISCDKLGEVGAVVTVAGGNVVNYHQFWYTFMVGISENGIDDAVDKLVARGYKVGRIEQMESASQAKTRGSNSVIERKLVHVSTPSTVADSNIGTDAVHLLALKEVTLASSGPRVYGFAFLDYAALKIFVGSLNDDDSSAALGALLVQVSPREIIYETSGSVKMQLTPISGIDFSDASQIQMLIHCKGYFSSSAESWVSALDRAVNRDAVICALGGLIGHLTRLMLHDALKNGAVLPYHVYKTCLRMDGQTLVNLEIFSNNFDGSSSGTLYKHLNHCITASGKRLLRRWICHPLKDIDAINKRLDVVEGFIQNCGLGPTTLEYLRKIPDLERLLGRVRSTVGLSSSIRLPFVGEKILKKRIKTFILLVNGLRNGIDLLNDLQRADHGVSELYKIVEIPLLSSLHELIHQFEENIQNEFPRYQDHDVKDDDVNTLALLVELFVGKASEWSMVIDAVSTIDVLRSFAAMTLQSFGAMCRPHILPKDSVPILRMKGMWHPYAFAESASGLVPNDLTLGQDLFGGNRFALLLTGPNMGGKSTVMRATCLTVVLAQLGCYVPCTSCELTLADSIFTRLGATDRIMSGESTFLVECTETASVLHNVTEDSLVLLDELGRGTSTFDGYAIAYAVFRHLVERVRCRLLFATHYHPLTKEFASHPHVSLQHMACMFKPRSGMGNGEKELTFLYRLTSGACPESYGLQVATMAGIPKSIVDRASVAGQMMRSKIAGNFKSSEGRAEFSTLHEEWLRTALAVSVKDGHLDEDIMDTLFCISQELKAHFRKAR